MEGQLRRSRQPLSAILARDTELGREIAGDAAREREPEPHAPRASVDQDTLARPETSMMRRACRVRSSV